MVVAQDNPLASTASKDLAFYTKLTIDPVMASEEDMYAAIESYYGAKSQVAHMKELVSALDRRRSRRPPTLAPADDGIGQYAGTPGQQDHHGRVSTTARRTSISKQ